MWSVLIEVGRDQVQGEINKLETIGLICFSLLVWYTSEGMLQCAGEFELLRLKGKLSKILERLKTFLTHLVLVNFTKNHLSPTWGRRRWISPRNVFVIDDLF